jgi:hypothetical protein
MSEDRIQELADALATALTAGDAEQFQSVENSMSSDERDAVMPQKVSDALLKRIGDRMDELLDALTAARSDDEQVHSIIDSMSDNDCRTVISLAVLRVASLEDRISLELDNAGDLVELAGFDGPFRFRTVDELSRVVELSTRVTFDALRHAEQLSVHGHDVIETKLADLLEAAEQLAAAQDLNRGLTPLELMTRWTPRLGRKTHAAVVPSHFTYHDERYETLCGRGSGYRAPLQRAGLDHIDCPGCRNALSLGGFLEPGPMSDAEREA